MKIERLPHPPGSAYGVIDDEGRIEVVLPTRAAATAYIEAQTPPRPPLPGKRIKEP